MNTTLIRRLKTILKLSGIAFCILVAAILFYRIFLFRNSAPLTQFVPQDIDTCITIDGGINTILEAKEFIPAPMLEHYSTSISADNIKLLNFLVTDDIALFSRGKEFGLTARLTLTGKFLMKLPNSFLPVTITESELGGNTVRVITAGKQQVYVSSQWDLVTVTTGTMLAKDTAELLNTRPIISPLRMNPAYIESVDTQAEGSTLFVRNRNWRLNGTAALLSNELSHIDRIGGTFTITPDEIKGTLSVTNSLPAAPILNMPADPKAFITCSLPNDIGRIWLDYCLMTKKQRNKTSFLTSITSDMFDSLINSFEPAVFLQAYSEDDLKSYPAAVLRFQSSLPLKPKELHTLMQLFAKTTDDLNKRKHHTKRVQRVTFEAKQETFHSVPVSYIELNPRIPDNFRPGVCSVNNTIFIATDYRLLQSILAPRVDSDEEPVINPYTLNINDPGLHRLLSFMQKALNDPAQKRKMGEAAYSRQTEQLQVIESWSANIGKITVSSNPEPELDSLTFSIQRNVQSPTAVVPAE